MILMPGSLRPGVENRVLRSIFKPLRDFMLAAENGNSAENQGSRYYVFGLQAFTEQYHGDDNTEKRLEVDERGDDARFFPFKRDDVEKVGQNGAEDQYHRRRPPQRERDRVVYDIEYRKQSDRYRFKKTEYEDISNDGEWFINLEHCLGVNEVKRIYHCTEDEEDVSGEIPAEVEVLQSDDNEHA